MPEIQLTPRDRIVLLSLMTIASGVSNKELKQCCGLDLTGAPRRRLVKAGLVTSELDGRAYRHELTEKGWHWTKKEMSVSYPERADTGTRGFYLFLNRIDRYLSRTGQSIDALLLPDGEPADLAAPSREDSLDLAQTPADLGVRIRQAVVDLTRAPGDWVTMTELRRKLADVPPDEMDAALNGMYQDPDIVIMANANERRLAAADRAAAVQIGGEDRHLIKVVAS